MKSYLISVTALSGALTVMSLGDDSVFCCATKKPDAATEGMEQAYECKPPEH